MHADVPTVGDARPARPTPSVPALNRRRASCDWRALAAGQRRRHHRAPRRATVQRRAAACAAAGQPRPRRDQDLSAVPDDRQVVEAPALVFDSQEALLAAFKAGELERDFVAVVRFQGPRANGMPELHKLTPPLAVLQGKGFKVALVTDGRMSGASGKVPAAIHVSPEALAGGAAGQGARAATCIRLDAVAGTLDALVDAATWAARDARAHERRSMPTPMATAWAASCSPACARNVHQRRSRAPAPGFEGCTHDQGHTGTRCARPGDPGHRAAARRARGADGARAGRRRRARARGDAAHAGGAGLHGGDRARRCPKPSSAPARCARWPMRAPRAMPAASSASARATPAEIGAACRDVGAAAAARRGHGQRGDGRQRRRLRLPEVLPGHCGGRHADAARRWPARSPTSCSAPPAASPPRRRRSSWRCPTSRSAAARG